MAVFRFLIRLCVALRHCFCCYDLLPACPITRLRFCWSTGALIYSSCYNRRQSVSCSQLNSSSVCMDSDRRKTAPKGFSIAIHCANLFPLLKRLVENLPPKLWIMSKQLTLALRQLFSSVAVTARCTAVMQTSAKTPRCAKAPSMPFATIEGRRWIILSLCILVLEFVLALHDISVVILTRGNSTGVFRF